MRYAYTTLLLWLLPLFPLQSQTDPNQIGPLLSTPIQAPEVTAAEFYRYVTGKIPRLSPPKTDAEWTAETKRLRRHLLDEVIFHGWPREWVESPLKVEDLGPIPCGEGYRMRKLRYEIVPGMHSTAILYEPATISGKIPAILNVNGHVGEPGKAVEYKQKRCINQARQGILALNLEWFGCGELMKVPSDSLHWFSAYLDLAGANGVALFYLAMRKGLDYLYQHPAVDRRRIGMTGLSGGGWQTIVLSALDERVAVAVPVAGHSSYLSRLESMREIGDLEQNPTDMFANFDYAHLTAMRAPRPTLLIYNVEDSCCFRAPMVKLSTYDAVIPFFRLYGKTRDFAWHENLDPGDHNYQLENRVEAYRFFSKHFGIPEVASEIPVDSEIKTFDELKVGLPDSDLRPLDMARKLASKIDRPAIPSKPAELLTWTGQRRATLERIVRYRPVEVENAWMSSNTKRKGLETESYRFALTSGLSATGVWLKALTTRADSPTTIILHDKGRKSALMAISDRINRGEQVLALELLLTADPPPARRSGLDTYASVLATIGERALGVEVAQLLAVTRWLQKRGSFSIRVESTGIRSQVVSLTAAALAPDVFSELVVRGGMTSLGHLLDLPVEFRDAADLFCLDLYKEFDLDRLAAVAYPTKVTRR